MEYNQEDFERDMLRLGNEDGFKLDYNFPEDLVGYSAVRKSFKVGNDVSKGFKIYKDSFFRRLTDYEKNYSDPIVKENVEKLNNEIVKRNKFLQSMNHSRLNQEMKYIAAFHYKLFDNVQKLEDNLNIQEQFAHSWEADLNFNTAMDHYVAEFMFLKEGADVEIPKESWTEIIDQLRPSNKDGEDDLWKSQVETMANLRGKAREHYRRRREYHNRPEKELLSNGKKPKLFDEDFQNKYLDRNGRGLDNIPIVEIYLDQYIQLIESDEAKQIVKQNGQELIGQEFICE